MLKKLFLLLTVLLVAVLAACSFQNDAGKKDQNNKHTKTTDQNSKKQTDSKSKKDTTKTKGNQKQKTWKQKLTAPKPPATIKDVVNTSVGKLADLHLDSPLDNPKAKDNQTAMKTFKKLPKLKNASNEELDAYWQKTHELFHKDYPSPDKVLKVLKYASFGSPDIKDDRFHFKQNLNVEILLDASGSMAGRVEGKSKMEIAKDTIQQFASSLPKGARVSLRVYGQKGTGSQSDKKMSCGSTELVYGLQSYNEKKLNHAMNKFKPAGWTPITLAIKKAQKDLSKYPAKKNTNIVYLVGDGINTCGGDPVKAAKDLSKSNVNPIVNIIGFNIDSKGQQQLKKVAKAADGLYTSVNNQDQLKQQLNQAESMAKKWADWKDNAKSQAENKFYDKDFKIFGFTVNWEEKRLDERQNMWWAWQQLKNEDYIDDKAYSYLMDKRNNHFTKMKKIEDKMKERLESINSQNYKDAKKSIEKAYHQNTD